MENTSFNELAKRAFESAKAKGFHDVEHEDGHWLMLVVCELAEAVEADRDGRRADRQTYDFLLADYGKQLRRHLFEMHIKDTVEDELADAAIRMLDFLGMKGYEIPDDYITKENIKMTLNSTYLSEEWKGIKTFTGRVLMSGVGTVVRMGDCAPDAVLYSVFSIAELYGIDLMWYVKEKMWYNEHREYMHGKKY